MIIRAFWRTIAVEDAQPPYDRINLKTFYPADNSQTINPFSITPAAKDLAPFPIIIFFSGFNCSLSMYQWLAIELAKQGLVVVLFDRLVKTDQNVFLTPGVDRTAFSKQNYGRVFSASALLPLLDELDNLQSTGILAGLLDLQTIILGGHSAGGRLALENANPQLCDRLAGAFSYGAHLAAPTSFGHPAGTILSLPDSLPMFIIGGTEDGVIANNSKIYGIETWSTPAEPVIRTFKEGINSERGDSCLVVIEGANHFAIADYTDSTLSIMANDFAAIQPEAETRSLIASTTASFINTFICKRSPKLQFEQLLQTHSHLTALSEFK